MTGQHTYIPPSATEIERLQVHRADTNRLLEQTAAVYQAKTEELKELRTRLSVMPPGEDPNERAALYDRQRHLADLVSATMLKVNALRRQVADFDEAISKAQGRVRAIDRALAARRVELGPEGYYTQLVASARARLEQAETARRKMEQEVEDLLKSRRALAPDSFEAPENP